MAAITGCFELPEDVMIEILSRLPVVSLLRFKSVRKSWYDLIKTPKFISKHLNYSPSNDDDNPCIVLKHCNILRNRMCSKLPTRRAFVSFLSNEAVHLSHDIEPPFFDDDNLCSNNIKFYGPCNGIICVHAALGRIGGWHGHFIALWNPATREIKRLSDSNLHHRDDAGVVFLDIGFGFDSKSNDYKVIRMIDFKYHKTRQRIWEPIVEVYTSSTDSWTRMGVILPTKIHFVSGFSTYSNGVYYWLVNDDKGEFVLAFNFADEMFEKIPFPDINNHNNRVSTLVKFSETIAVIINVLEDAEDINNIVVFVLNMDRDGEKNRWTKFYKIPFEPVCVVGFLRSGEALMIVGSDDGGNELTLYDPSTQLLKNLRVYDSTCHSFQMVHNVESLVSFKGLSTSQIG